MTRLSLCNARQIACLLLASLVGGTAYGQSSDDLRSSSLELRDADINHDADSGRDGWLALPYVSYAPETGLVFGAGYLHYFCLSDDQTLRLSHVRASASYTLQSQLSVSVAPSLWLDHDRQHLSLDLGFTDDRIGFSGVGNGIDPSIDEPYSARTISARASYERQLVPNLYLGGLIDFSTVSLTEMAADGLLESGHYVGLAGGQSIGVGAMLSWDDTDRSFAPRTGRRANLEVLQYLGALGSDYDFTHVEIDARWYIPVVAQHVLSVQAVGQFNFGATPFYQLAQLGGDELLRGYIEGQYRDDHLLSVQAEYRLPLFWRFGLVGFAGVGQVFSSLDEIGVDNLRVSGGGGLRFAVDEEAGVNVRLDVGVGPGTTGFYLNIGEAI